MQNADFDSNKGLYKRLLVRGILAIGWVVFLVLILPKAIHLLLPFVIVFIVATALNPFVNKINKKYGVSRRIIALILDLLVFITVFALIGLLVYSVVNEAVTLATNIQLNWDSIVAKFNGLDESFEWLNNLLPSPAMNLLDSIEESIFGFIQNASKNLLDSVVPMTTTMTAKAGGFFINFIMSILAAYFIIADYNRIATLTRKLLGKRVGGYLSILKTSVITALGGYLKSQLLLALFAFLFMFVALVIYGQPYAFLIALFLGFIDFLPIIGTIAILVPWGIIELVNGDMNKGSFLIIISVVFFLLRKIVEPKIVGSQTGLHPLMALMSAYVGLQFSGVWGAILGPIVLMLIISISKSGILDSTISDLKLVVDNISKTLNRSNDILD